MSKEFPPLEKDGTRLEILNYVKREAIIAKYISKIKKRILLKSTESQKRKDIKQTSEAVLS